jgi:hypothetical protein
MSEHIKASTDQRGDEIDLGSYRFALRDRSAELRRREDHAIRLERHGLINTLEQMLSLVERLERTETKLEQAETERDLMKAFLVRPRGNFGSGPTWFEVPAVGYFASRAEAESALGDAMAERFGMEPQSEITERSDDR